MSDPNIPEGKENIAYKAAELMLDRFKIDEDYIYIDKNIPSAAGLGAVVVMVLLSCLESNLYMI